MNAEGFTTEGLALAATIILLFPMLYFLFLSMTFYLRPLADPVVGRMLRGLFSAYLLAVAACGGVAILAFLGAHQPRMAALLSLLAAGAVAARAWSLPRLDTLFRARDAGVPQAIPGLRRLHLAGMAYNAIQIAIVLACIPLAFPMR